MHRRYVPHLEVLEVREVPAVLVSPLRGLLTSELGGSNVVTVALTTAPTANVVMEVHSDNIDEGIVSPAKLTFTPANWRTPQKIRVTGQEDGVRDGDKTYHVIVQPTSTDPNYSSVAAITVTLINKDSRRVAGIAVTPLSGLVTTESGGRATFTVKLTSPPKQAVTIPLLSSNTAEGTVSPGALTFTPANWNVAQTVTVKGVDDNVIDGDQPYTIQLLPAISADSRYNGMNGPDVSVTNRDNDQVRIWDGHYVGSYSGTVTYGGKVSYVSGQVDLTVSNGVITLHQPAAGTGTISAKGSAVFGSLGGGSKTTYSGMIAKSGTQVLASGGWALDQSTPFGAVVGHGTWTAHRV